MKASSVPDFPIKGYFECPWSSTGGPRGTEAEPIIGSRDTPLYGQVYGRIAVDRITEDLARGAVGRSI